MRHQNRVKKLGRNAEHRKALLRNLALFLLKKERIITTTARAKALRGFVEKIITKAKKKNLHTIRLVARDIRDKVILKKLFEDIALRYQNRPGGYTRVYKLYNRPGDAAEMAMIELVEEKLEETKEKK